MGTPESERLDEGDRLQEIQAGIHIFESCIRCCVDFWVVCRRKVTRDVVEGGHHLLDGVVATLEVTS